MKKTTQKEQVKRYVKLLKMGDERGLDFFYKRYFGYLFSRTFRATKDDCISESIAQEALLRLWIFRNNIRDSDDILLFLKKQVRSAVHSFFTKSNNRFNRDLLRLDGIENFQEFMLGYEMEENEEIDIEYLEKLDSEKHHRLDQLNKLLPSLDDRQQLFVKLCLKYSFNYERIAYYLGGISDYEVSLQVERTIENLRDIFSCSKKLELIDSRTKIIVQGELDQRQSEIFQLRYEFRYTFEQISEALNLDTSHVRKLFVQAHAKLKKSKKTA